MKLSEAIRLGSTMKPQAFGAFYVDGGSCALGAAADAIGLNADEDALDTAMWPLLNVVLQPTCPECGRDAAHRNKDHGDQDVIVHLNDVHRWTRERIADFVEQIENQQEPELTEACAQTANDKEK